MTPLTKAERAAVLRLATGATKARATKDEEHQAQSLLFQRLALDPRTRDALIYAVPNFAGRLGQATARHGARLKAEGRKRGVPDINVDEARGGYHGLRVEMKSRTGTLSPEQRAWLAALALRGYATAVCRTADAAFACIVGYLTLEDKAC